MNKEREKYSKTIIWWGDKITIIGVRAAVVDAAADVLDDHNPIDLDSEDKEIVGKYNE